MRTVTITTLGVLGAAAIAAISSVATAVITARGAESGGPPHRPLTINITSGGAGHSAGLKPASAKCPSIHHVGSPLWLEISVEDPNDLASTCPETLLKVGRLSSQKWWTEVYNSSDKPVDWKNITLKWILPKGLTVVPGTTFFYDPALEFGYLVSDSTAEDGQYTGSFAPHSWMFISFITVTNSKQIPACTEKTIWLGANLTSGSGNETANAWARIYVTDANRYC